MHDQSLSDGKIRKICRHGDPVVGFLKSAIVAI